MYSNEMDKSLKLNESFIKDLSKKELEDLMAEFDNYEVEINDNCWFPNSNSFNNYLQDSYKKYKLFEYFDIQQRKSVNLKQDIIKKNPKRVLFSFINVI